MGSKSASSLNHDIDITIDISYRFSISVSFIFVFTSPIAFKLFCTSISHNRRASPTSSNWI